MPCFRWYSAVCPGIIGVGNDLRAGAVQKTDHIALLVEQVEVGATVVHHCHRTAVGIVGEVQLGAVVFHVRQLTAVVGVLVGIGTKIDVQTNLHFT